MGAAAAEASVLAHLFDEFLLETFRLELRRAVDEERRIYCGDEALLEEWRRRVLQQRAGVEIGRGSGIIVQVRGPYIGDNRVRLILRAVSFNMHWITGATKSQLGQKLKVKMQSNRVSVG